MTTWDEYDDDDLSDEEKEEAAERSREVGRAWAAFRKEIDRRLDERRPKRADVGDRTWREAVYGWARNHIPDEQNLVRNFARRQVDFREGQATKRGNDRLREYLKGRRPLAWDLLGPLPIKVGDERIRYDAASPEDVDTAATELAAKAKGDYDEVQLLVVGMRELASRARERNLRTVAQLGDQPPAGQAAA